MLKVINPVKYTQGGEFDEDQMIDLIERLSNEKPVEVLIGNDIKQYEKALKEYLKNL